uniref:EF-hand domain-containing protein n=1 Tax=Globisporangium ultimum (strain ATCC 200006 / CBS 805.95 / DAOM BR144) TaxID=431595 RepID=K3WCE5_GLOUD
MGTSGISAAEPKFVVSLVATSAVELFVNVTRTRKFDTVAASILERCVDPSTILELLGREACVSTPHLASSGFGIMDKQRLWTSMLRLDSRALTQRIVAEGFLDHSVVAALHDPSPLKQHSHAEIGDVRRGSRLEALMFLEVLVKLSSVLRQSVNVQLLFAEVCKLVLLHQTISKEATLRAIAKRALQVICCVRVDFSAQRVDRVFQERLEAIGIPLWVIHFHQSYPNASNITDATQQHDQAHLFWKDWGAQLCGSATKKPKSTLSQSSKVATTAMKHGAPEREERRPIVHFSDQPRQTALVTKTTRRECGTEGNEMMDEPVHRVSLAANEARKKPMVCCTVIHLAPELAIASPVKTHSTRTPTGQFSTNKQSKAPEKPAPDLVQTLMSIDFESAQILSRQTTPTAAAGAAVKESKQKKEKSNLVRDDDGESLGSDAYSPFPAASSSSSSSSASSRESDRKSRSRMKVRNAKAKRKQIRRRRDSREAKEGGRDEAKQHDTSSSRGSSSDGSETRRRSRGKKEPHRHNASRPPSSSEAASSSPSTAESPRRTMMRKSSHAASATDHAKEIPDPHVETLRRVFHKYDVDGDGAISFIDLRKALNNAQAQQRLTDVEIQKWRSKSGSRRKTAAARAWSGSRTFASHLDSTPLAVRE